MLRLHKAPTVDRMGEWAVHALRAVDLDLSAGEAVVLPGACGSDKAALPNILGGLDRPTSGAMRCRDHELTLGTTTAVITHKAAIADIQRNAIKVTPDDMSW